MGDFSASHLAEVWNSARYVQTQTHDVHHAIVEVNVVIGVLIVHGELLVVVRVVPVFLIVML